MASGFATIGRGDDCTIVLQDTSASRIHAKIGAIDAKKFRIIDNNSSNGLWIGDRKIADEVIEAGVKFRVGDSILECRPEVEEKAEADPSATGIMSGFADLMAKAAGKKLESEGAAANVTGTHAVLLDDPAQAFYVKDGKVEIFTVAVEDGKPVGGRNHFLTVQAGQLFFGMDLTMSAGSSFLASGKMGTEVRQIPLARLRQVAADPMLSEHVAALVDKWIEGLSSRLTRDIPAVSSDLALDTAKAVALVPGKRAKAGKGVIWVQAPSTTMMFIGLGMVGLDESRPMFPLTPRTWIELPADGGEGVTPRLRGTASAVKEDALWAGLDLFQQVLCECEFINKKLAVVDEFQRLKSKAQQSEAAQGCRLRRHRGRARGQDPRGGGVRRLGDGGTRVQGLPPRGRADGDAGPEPSRRPRGAHVRREPARGGLRVAVPHAQGRAVRRLVAA